MLRFSHPDWVAMQTRQSGLEGTGEIKLRDLVKKSLRMRPSRVIVGEVRAEECLDLLLALNSGLPGMASLHANSAREALVKMCTLPLLAGENISRLSAFGFVGPPSHVLLRVLKLVRTVGAQAGVTASRRYDAPRGQPFAAELHAHACYADLRTRRTGLIADDTGKWILSGECPAGVRPGRRSRGARRPRPQLG